VQRPGQQNVYSYSATFFGPNNGGIAASVPTEGNPWEFPDNILAADGSFTTSTVISALTTDTLRITNFNLTVPSTSNVSGIEVTVKGYAPSATVYAQLLQNGVAVGTIHSAVLPTTNGTVPMGGPNDSWGLAWNYASVDDTAFGVDIWVVSAGAATIALDSCQVTIYGSEASANFNGIFNANLNSNDLTTIALDALGLLWSEDVYNAPNILSRASLIPSVVPGSYMKGLDANGVAYMAFSDLKQGTSQPMQYNGQWADRITQVGPGAAPVFTPQQAGTDVFGITSITQPAQQVRGYSYFLQSAGPGNTSAGNNVTVYYSDSTLAGPDTDLVNAFNSGNAVYLYMEFTGTGIPTNGPYVVQVTSVGLASPPGQPRAFYYYTYTLPTSAYQYYQGSGHSTYTATYQRSLATLTASAPIPGLAVGNQIVVTGATPAAWNSTWGITQTLNSGAVSIGQTSVASGVATYGYTLVSGVAPAAGQLVTITGTLNDDGALNGADLLIVSSTGGATGTFTINVSAPDAASAAESGQGVTAGTQFAFDPGAADVGTSTDPIFGNTSVGGSLTFSASSYTFMTEGVKQGSVFFITRNGAVTRPANPVTFTVPANTESISATLIPIGPPNVVARGITFTESGQNGVPGGSFYTYDTPVTYTVSGVSYTASALIVPDNVTTSAVFTFPDSVLLASEEIDVPGNDYFNLIEIGSPVWMAQYANRMLYGLCQKKVQNFVNLSFDGGYLPGYAPQPLGWSNTGTIAGLSMQLVASADFGNSLQLLNTGASTMANTVVLYQTAYQDFYGVNILQPNTAYSVRLKGRALNADGQQVRISILPHTPTGFGPEVGGATFTLNQGGFTIQTAEILGALPVIASNLQLAIEIISFTPGNGAQIDRLEVFPTNDPSETTTIWTSYAGNFEAVDAVTGQLGCGDDNPQAAQGSFQLLEQLYIEKTRSRCVTQDSPNYEPNNWRVALASQGVGAIGPNAYYADEEFEISVNRPGIYLFDGGKPVPITRELQSSGTNGSLLEAVNWDAAETIWCRFSTRERRLYVGLPMILPNFWLPNAAPATPTSPNVILMGNFTGCPTAPEIEEAVALHTTIFGDLKDIDMRRKWSLWQIVCPVAEFITRADGATQPLFLCNGTATSKIYQLVNGAASGGQNTDDGAPINWLYTTYGFTKAKQGQQIPGLGALRKVWYYFAALLEGTGKVAIKFYSNSLGALPRNTYTAPQATLSFPQQNDWECPLEIGGQRLFVEISSVGSGGYAEIGGIMLDGEMDKNAPHRGMNG